MKQHSAVPGFLKNRLHGQVRRNEADRRTAAKKRLPPDTILFSQMMAELSQQPGFVDTLLGQLNLGQKRGPALLTPALIDRMRLMILGEDWHGLDHFPGWTMREINPALRAVEHLATQYEHEHPIKSLLNLGPYAVDQAETIDLNEPSDRAEFSFIKQPTFLGDGVVSGDGPNPEMIARHPESQRLAEVLNRLSVNGLEETADAEAKIAEQTVTTPEQLMQVLMETGHEITVADARYFANYGHFHYQGKNVMMPFWVNAQMRIPGTQRSLLVPVTHAEYEWTIRGPRINADLAWYFAIDGRAEFRTMDERSQPWILGRKAHIYHGADAVEITRLVGKMTVAYARLHQSHPTLPFGGYYALGVCQDSVSAIEMKMIGKVTLFPNTADISYFTDPRDSEVNALIRAVPKDRFGVLPEPERIYGALPTTDLRRITIPGLADDLQRVRRAWARGRLQRMRGEGYRLMVASAKVAGALAIVGTALWVWRRRR